MPSRSTPYSSAPSHALSDGTALAEGLRCIIDLGLLHTDDLCTPQACTHAASLQPSQVPLILWAFAMLNYNPLVAVLSALDQQVERLSSQITAQVYPRAGVFYMVHFRLCMIVGVISGEMPFTF